eukprot:SAG31_NODE_39671_length_286_cov_1.106952_1_plen_44_part_10
MKTAEQHSIERLIWACSRARVAARRAHCSSADPSLLAEANLRAV